MLFLLWAKSSFRNMSIAGWLGSQRRSVNVPVFRKPRMAKGIKSLRSFWSQAIAVVMVSRSNGGSWSFAFRTVAAAEGSSSFNMRIPSTATCDENHSMRRTFNATDARSKRAIIEFGFGHIIGNLLS
jgi:hypothetical protein